MARTRIPQDRALRYPGQIHGAVIGQAETLFRVLDHPHHRGNDPERDLDRCSVLAGWSFRASSMERMLPVHHELYGWPIRSAPRMSDPPDISRSFIIRSWAGVIVPAPQLVQRCDRCIAGHVRVVHGRPVDRPTILPDRPHGRRCRMPRRAGSPSRRSPALAPRTGSTY